jgi:hypothetical protein
MVLNLDRRHGSAGKARWELSSKLKLVLLMELELKLNYSS